MNSIPVIIYFTKLNEEWNKYTTHTIRTKLLESSLITFIIMVVLPITMVYCERLAEFLLVAPCRLLLLIWWQRNWMLEEKLQVGKVIYLVVWLEAPPLSLAGCF